MTLKSRFSCCPFVAPQHVAIWIFCLFFFFLSLLICVYSLHFTAAWVRRREQRVGGRGWQCIVDQSAFVATSEKGEDGDFEWMFFKARKGGEHKVVLASVEEAAAGNTGRCFEWHASVKFPVLKWHHLSFKWSFFLIERNVPTAGLLHTGSTKICPQTLSSLYVCS